MPPPSWTPALAYLRTSSATNVGPDKDSETRQRAAVAAYARRARLEVVGEHYDAAVSGADFLDARTGFTDLLARAEVDNTNNLAECDGRMMKLRQKSPTAFAP